MKIRTSFRNTGDKEIGLQVEPWGEYYRIAPGQKVEIVIVGPSPDDPDSNPTDAGLLEIDHDPECITVYAWSGAEVEVTGAEMAPWPTATK